MNWASLINNGTDILGWIAAVFVLAAFWAKGMMRLRVLAIASNFAFMGYGYFDHLWPVLSLHAVCLPVNIFRLWQILLERGLLSKCTIDT